MKSQSSFKQMYMEKWDHSVSYGKKKKKKIQQQEENIIQDTGLLE